MGGIVKLNNDLKPVNDAITALFFYDKDKLPKEFLGLVDETESKKYGSIRLISSVKRTILVGLGDKKKLSLEKIRRIGANIYNSAKTETSGIIIKTENKLDDTSKRSLLEGFILAQYEFTKYKSEKKPAKLKEFSIDYKNQKTLISDHDRISVISNKVFIVRDLVNEPANAINPTTFIDVARKLVKNTSIGFQVLSKKDLVKNGMGGILAVGSGSKDEPALAILTYSPRKDGKHIALVGKGVTFDSGGYNLKPTGYIETMKQDMAGAATVLGIALAAEELKIKKNLIVYMPLVENMINHNSYRPGDIIKMHSGKTVEISNTDAEGRLILADALYYAQSKKPEVIFDFATLTGAMVVALGNTITGVFTNDDSVYQGIFEVSKNTGEQVWQLPVYEEHEESLKADYADLKSIGYVTEKGGAGSITAAAFLKQFVNDTKWVHFDIAGTAFSSENKDYIKKGGTGVMVRTIVAWLEK